MDHMYFVFDPTVDLTISDIALYIDADRILVHYQAGVA